MSGRFFIVGCERSGTTLLQAMLARHPRVFSFPESHFFCRAASHRLHYRLLGLANWRRSRVALHQLLTAIRRQDLVYEIPRYSPFLRSLIRAFCGIVDRVTLEQKKDIWVEKTPHHLYEIPVIQRYLPSVKFIHILRDGRDVAASIKDASIQDPDYWGTWSLDALAEIWNKAVQESFSYRDDPAHILVSYDSLLDDPSGELARLCKFMNVDFEPEMLQHWKAADGVVGWMKGKPWMQSPYQPLHDTRLKKFISVFSKEQREYLAEHLQWDGSVLHLFDGATEQAKRSWANRSQALAAQGWTNGWR